MDGRTSISDLRLTSSQTVKKELVGPEGSNFYGILDQMRLLQDLKDSS